MAKKHDIEYAVAVAIHKEVEKVGVCGQDCDHIDEARAAIKAYRLALRRPASRKKNGGRK